MKTVETISGLHQREARELYSKFYCSEEVRKFMAAHPEVKSFHVSLTLKFTPTDPEHQEHTLGYADPGFEIRNNGAW
jgi:hypothetical protein